MLGLGETHQEIRDAMGALRGAGVEVLTLGQYLQPTGRHLEVERYLPPEEFTELGSIAEEEFGFAFCASGPLVRSSYKAAEVYLASRLGGETVPTETGTGRMVV